MRVWYSVQYPLTHNTLLLEVGYGWLWNNDDGTDNAGRSGADTY